jgi:thioredoxin-related protein
MKKIILALVCIIAVNSVFAQGIVWKHTLKEAQKESVKTGKPIFMSVSTTWCGPCKMMAKKVFPTKEVGDYFNTNFVNLKIIADVEKDPELRKLIELLKVDSYPTHLFLDDQFKVLAKKTGGASAAVFLNDITKMMSPKKNLKMAEFVYRNNPGSPDWAINYFNIKINNGIDCGDELSDFISKLSVDQILSSNAVLKVAFGSFEDINCNKFKSIVTNRSKAEKLFNEPSEFQNLVDDLILKTLMDLALENNHDSYDIAFEKSKLYTSEARLTEISDRSKLEFVKSSDNKKVYYNGIISYFLTHECSFEKVQDIIKNSINDGCANEIAREIFKLLDHCASRIKIEEVDHFKNYNQEILNKELDQLHIYDYKAELQKKLGYANESVETALYVHNKLCPPYMRRGSYEFFSVLNCFDE